MTYYASMWIKAISRSTNVNVIQETKNTEKQRKKISGTKELLEIEIQRTPSTTQGYTFGKGPLRSLFSCCLNFAYFCQRFSSLKLNVCKMKSFYKLIVAL